MSTFRIALLALWLSFTLIALATSSVLAQPLPYGFTQAAGAAPAPALQEPGQIGRAHV